MGKCDDPRGREGGAREEILVIGAGPAGLASAAVLQNAGIPARILERGAEAGGAYAKIRPSLQLLTPVDYVSLPLTRYQLPPGDTRVRADHYAQYLKSYAHAHALRIEYGVEVTRIDRESDGYVVSDRSGKRSVAQHVVVATGLFDFPKPQESLRGRYPGAQWLEAAEWKDGDSLAGRRVLIVGSGITASELAVALCGKSGVALATRGPLRFLPASFLGLPIHRWVAPLERLPKGLLPAACHPSWREPLIEVGLREAVRCGKVSLFENGTLPGAAEIDVVINATGYRFETAILPYDIARNERGEVRLRGNMSLSHPGLFLLGYPCSGGVDSKYLRGIHRDALRVLRSIQRRWRAERTPLVSPSSSAGLG